MGEPGFWDDQERAAKVSAEHARASRRLRRSATLERDVEDLEPLAELAEEDPEIASELEEQIALGPGAPGRARGAAAVLRPLRRRRRARHRQRRRRRHRRPGLGRDGAADGDALGREARLRGRAARGVARGRRPASSRPRSCVKGENAYGLYGAEKGVHRLVRLSPFDAAHRRQTSFAGVEVSPVVEEIGEVEIDDDDLQIDTYRASGAGGQHVNKTDSAVRITHKPTGIVVQCQNERSQSSNKAEAMTMLRSKLLELEERKRREEIARERGEAQDVNFGSQIRSYVLHPYTMVKDHRTDFEMGDAARVLDGDLDGFVRAYLLQAAK